jgi:murein DD-endopeptidase MepM/ murein hydrolase activator NlpD
MFAGEPQSCEAPTGITITLDHRAHGFATYYGHLSKMFVAANYYFDRNKKRQRVCAGDVIGYAAKSPIEIRFSLWQWTDRGFVPVDPIPKLEEWRKPLTTSNTSQAA